MTKILLVEDDKSLREIYGVRLLAEGYDIVSAGDGEEALAMAIKERPDMIVSDVMMPKISGFDMLDILRSTTETRDIKVIMMTALSSEDQRARGEQLGADRYLVKSQVGIEDVVRAVHEVLGDQSGAAPTVVPPQAQPVDQQPAAPAPAAPQFAAPTPAPQPQQPVVQPSTLPQPTAPFSSPRPATLGERVIHPIENGLPDAEAIERQIAQELQASAIPVEASQVDELPDDTPALSAMPAAAPAPAAPQFAAPTPAPQPQQPGNPNPPQFGQPS